MMNPQRDKRSRDSFPVTAYETKGTCWFWTSFGLNHASWTTLWLWGYLGTASQIAVRYIVSNPTETLLTGSEGLRGARCYHRTSTPQDILIDMIRPNWWSARRLLFLWTR